VVCPCEGSNGPLGFAKGAEFVGQLITGASS
jgi:hypothetical protein